MSTKVPTLEPLPRPGRTGRAPAPGRHEAGVNDMVRALVRALASWIATARGALTRPAENVSAPARVAKLRAIIARASDGPLTSARRRDLVRAARELESLGETDSAAAGYARGGDVEGEARMLTRSWSRRPARDRSRWAPKARPRTIARSPHARRVNHSARKRAPARGGGPGANFRGWLDTRQGSPDRKPACVGHRLASETARARNGVCAGGRDRPRATARPWETKPG